MLSDSTFGRGVFRPSIIKGIVCDLLELVKSRLIRVSQELHIPVIKVSLYRRLPLLFVWAYL